LAQRLRNDLDAYLDMLSAIERFYASVGGMSRRAFQTFVQHSFARHTGLQALSWDRRVLDVRRDAYEEAIREEGYSDFQITEQDAHGKLVRAARRPEYVVVSYIEPSVGNGRALGFDVASSPDRLDALRRARDTGQPTATGCLMLVQETGRQSGLLVFLPMYDHGLPHATLEERRQNLHGYATGVFQITDMVEASLPDIVREGLELRIEDEAAPTDQRLLYDSRERVLEGVNLTREGAYVENPTRMHWQTTVGLAGRR
jgi:CHASE1-domain containing sensor protein